MDEEGYAIGDPYAEAAKMIDKKRKAEYSQAMTVVFQGNCWNEKGWAMVDGARRQRCISGTLVGLYQARDMCVNLILRAPCFQRV